MSAKAMLLILDGWGIGPNPDVSAIAQANTSYMDQLLEKYPHSTLITHGEDVGLPEGQMGNSEVGHLNIGAGRVVYQELARINKAVKDKVLHQHPVLLKALGAAKNNNSSVHLMGLVSDGGVHSHLNHLKALCDICDENDIKNVFIHAFTDGRDTDPKSGEGFLSELTNHIKDKSAQIATVVGRYFAMDRDKRWERIKKAYDLLVSGKGTPTSNIIEAVKKHYQEGITDEFLEPIINSALRGEAKGTIQPGDTVICFNFRTDRPRQITHVLSQEDMPEHGMYKLDTSYLSMTRYDDKFKNIDVLFEKDDLKNTMGEILEQKNKTQVRIAETEKYPHVTFFFSGGREKPFEKERRLLIPSPKVATYDLQPEMSAIEITDTIIKDIRENTPDFICLNYANTDMVGHTGVFKAAVKAAETVDACLKRLIAVALEHKYNTIIIADHGNSDYMVNSDGSPNTAHTKNPVPCIYIAENATDFQIKDGCLADVAPTLLHLMEVEAPEEMTGEVLLHS